MTMKLRNKIKLVEHLLLLRTETFVNLSAIRKPKDQNAQNYKIYYFSHSYRPS